VRVLVAGCGDLGTAVGLRFAAAGHDVVGMRRRAELLPAPLVPLVGDLGGGLPPLPADVEVVVLSAAAGGRSEDAYRQVYLDGSRRVLEALDAAGASPRRVLFVSSTAVYGDADGGFVDEATPTAPGTATGAVLVAAEAAVADGPFPATAVRLAGIYGPGRTRLIDLVRAGDARLPRRPSPTNRIHRDDAAAAIVHLATAVDDPAPVYVGVDHATADRGEVLRFLADELGLPPPPPEDDVDGPQAGGRRGGDKRCRNDRLVATGFTFRFPTYREGYRSVLRGEGTRHP
jgi:nucleoside-diphosphate-sugar epimerase